MTIEDWEKSKKTKVNLDREWWEEWAKENAKVYSKHWKWINFNETVMKAWMKSDEPWTEIKPILSEVVKKRKFEPWEKAGLSPEPYDEKTLRKDPTTWGYVKSPNTKTLADLLKQRWESIALDLTNNEKKNHLDIIKRLKEKENAH